MENKKVHYIIIPILILLLIVYGYQRFNKIQKITSESNTLTSEELQVGNCYSYENAGVYYGVILVKSEQDDIFTVGLLDAVKKEELEIKDFKTGDLQCAKHELVKGIKVSGLQISTFFSEDVKLFRQKFKYIGKLNLESSKIIICGGGTLIVGSDVRVKSEHDSKLLTGIVRYNEPVINYIEE